MNTGTLSDMGGKSNQKHRLKLKDNDSPTSAKLRERKAKRTFLILTKR
jgi:hypothetical protein